MTNLYLVPIGEDWISKFERTVEEPIEVTGEDIPTELSDFEEVRIWGTTETNHPPKPQNFEDMELGDLVLFSHQGNVFSAGRVGRTFESSEVGEWAWGNEESSWIYTITDFEEVEIPSNELWDLLGYSDNYYLQGFTRASDSAIDELLQKYTSVEEAFQDLKQPPEDTPQEEQTEIDGSIETTEESLGRETDDEVKDEKEEARDHIEIQWKLIQLGLRHGYEVYVAKNDRNQTYDGNRLGEDCVEQLSLTGFSDAAISIIEYVDVIWLEEDYIVKMFEVESTTSIYSGILRMTDFIVKVPNLGVDMYIVASEADEEQVRKQINRPTFQQVLTQADYCSLDYLSFERVRDRYELVQRAGALQSIF
jgi:hypothetical protein